MNKSKHLRNILNHVISVVSNSPSLFSVNPKSDFTRNRKLSFETVIKNVIRMEAGSLKDELLKLNDYSSFTPTSSTFVQARSKIKHDAFKTIFDTFNQKSLVTKTLKGYRLLAIDGTVLPIDNSFADEENSTKNQ